jgi:hypothetical protein
MARAFRRRGGGATVRYVTVLDAEEREIVADLMDQVRALLEPPDAADHGDDEFGGIVAGMDLGEESGAPGAPGADDERDPALDRLLPSGNREDSEAAAEYRRLTETSLRRRKSDALRAAAAALRGERDKVSLDAAGARSFVAALTDVRLVLGERLNLRSDEDLDVLEDLARRLEPGEPLVHVLALYDFLTWLQETLTGALLGE